MSRQLLPESQIHPDIQTTIDGQHRDTLNEVISALDTHPVVVIGMAHNPFCKKVRTNLDAAKVSYHYLEYGNYFNNWKKRLEIKLWCGWKTFPMVFAHGQLLGGNQEVKALIDSGQLQNLLDKNS